MAEYQDRGPEAKEALRVALELVTLRRNTRGPAYGERLRAVAEEVQPDAVKLIALIDTFTLMGHTALQGWADAEVVDILDLMRLEDAMDSFGGSSGAETP